MSRKRQIQVLVLSSFTMILIGVLVVFLIYIFLLLVLGNPLKPSEFPLLTSRHDILHLTKLIPLFFGIGGFFMARKILSDSEKKDISLQKQSKAIERTIHFANNIKKGNLDTAFESSNGDSELQEALESMRINLIQAQKKEDQRNLINNHVNSIGQILRAKDDLNEIGFDLIKYMVDKLAGVVQGAFYIVVNNEQEGIEEIQLFSSYAYKRKKQLNSKYRFGEGLVGQAAIEKDIIHRTEIPEDYATITSGLLGEKKPSSLIIVPLITEEKVVGVLELASIEKFTALHIEFLSRVSDISARSINNMQVAWKTRALLDESEKMRTELSEKQEQLVLHAEEMTKTQEKLQHSNVKLEEQIQQTKISNKRTNVFLSNSLEVIFVIGKDGTNLFASPAVKNVLGYFPEEVIGYKTVDNLHPLDVDRLEAFLDEIKSYPEKDHSLQFRYFTKDGKIIWLEAIGKNALNDELIKGYVLNVRDISQQRLAAKEQRMRAKMQALSENSPDLILRIDIFSRCTYINPVFKELTGMNISDILDKPIANSGVDSSIIDFWKKMLDSVVESREKLLSEMTFPTPNGERIMAVSAIPEYSENGDVESTLIVCHDITQAKNREEVIRKKNISISDSINYALNIQLALMPTEKMIQERIPNSFMMYKPKDIVSGDYPYMFVNGDDIYIGAMDCTGHGVPGALMSIIGFFLQNQAMQIAAEDFDAGLMLDNLHQNIVTTLKQDDEDSNLNDGMDAAMVRVNTKKMTLDFAGAHRPLYHVRNNTLKVIKGDRFPVGSTQYANRKPFNNHEIEILPGDAFYFMTDGFPDQLGGESGKEKYMSGRVNLLIQDNTHLSIFQMGNLFKRTFSEWKGEAKQVDDILIIGLKF